MTTYAQPAPRQPGKALAIAAGIFLSFAAACSLLSRILSAFRSTSGLFFLFLSAMISLTFGVLLAVYSFAFFGRPAGKVFLVSVLFADAAWILLAQAITFFGNLQRIGLMPAFYRFTFFFSFVLSLVEVAALVLLALGKLTRSRGALIAALCVFAGAFLLGRVSAAFTFSAGFGDLASFFRILMRDPVGVLRAVSANIFSYILSSSASLCSFAGMLLLCLAERKLLSPLAAPRQAPPYPGAGYTGQAGVQTH